MESNTIRDSDITASSELKPDHGARNARLNQLSQSDRIGAWSAEMDDTEQWIQVNLTDGKLVRGVMTQGRPDCDEWVTEYTVQYSNDAITWYNITGENQTVMVRLNTYVIINILVVLFNLNIKIYCFFFAQNNFLR